jgi:hypothetical protein
MRAAREHKRQKAGARDARAQAQPRTIVLIGCAKKKQKTAAPAGELYTSTLFKKARAYAQRHGDDWRILSALHGLLDPSETVEPYNVTLNSYSKRERQQWAEGRVLPSLTTLAPAGSRIIIVAGRAYYEHLERELSARGYQVEIPTRGLNLFEMLRYLTEDAAA